MSTEFVPRPYQPPIIAHIQNQRRVACWADMGLGKTVATLTAIEFDLALGAGPALVLAPLRVAREVWATEARKWKHLRHLRVVPILGDAATRGRALRTPADVYTINYDNLPWLVETCGDAWPFRIVVADEATRLKSFRLHKGSGSKRAQMLARVAHRRIERFVALTGTPCPNGLLDLWGQTWFIDAGARLGRTFTAFKDRWFRLPHQNAMRYEPLPHAYDEIMEQLQDVVMSVRARDYFDLAAPIVNHVEVELPVRVMKLYRELERQMFIGLEALARTETVTAVNAAALTAKCLQLSNGAVYVDGTPRRWETVHDEKIEALRSVVEESGGAPLIVAYQFVSDLARLQKAFPYARVLDANPRTITEWNEGRIAMLLAHPKSAGHGLNLQHGGNRLVFFGHDWNLEEHDQIIERIGPVRQMQSGYNRPVYLTYIVARGTLDLDVMLRRTEKRAVQDILLDRMRKGRP